MKNLLSLLLSFVVFSLSAQSATVSRSKLANELSMVIRAMETYHPNAYHYVDSVEVADYRAELLTDLPESFDRLEAYRRLNQLTCLFGDGHTRIWAHDLIKDYQEKGGKYFPYSVVADRGRLTITQPLNDVVPDLSGQQITAINGIPAATLITAMSTHASRETAELDLVLLSNNFKHYLWLTYGWETYEVATSTIESKASTHNVSGLSYPELQLPATKKEAALTAKMLDESTAYLRILSFEGRPKTYRKHFANIFNNFNAAGADRLILDLRGHGGGDSRVGNELARYLSNQAFHQFAYSEWKATAALKSSFKNNYLPGGIHWALPLIKGMNPHTKAIYGAEDNENARVDYPLIKPYGSKKAFTGEVYLLMDNNTFSAGTCFAAMFKDYQMGTIIGQESGNLANFHADGLTWLKLEASGVRLQVSNSYLVRPSGDESPEPVQPDIVLEQGADALAYTLEWLGVKMAR